MLTSDQELYRLGPSNDPEIGTKAEALLPKVRFLQKGVFIVGSQNGERREYKVLIQRRGAEFWGSCTCPHFRNRLVKGDEAEPCKHIQAALVWGLLKEQGKLQEVLEKRAGAEGSPEEVVSTAAPTGTLGQERSASQPPRPGQPVGGAPEEKADPNASPAPAVIQVFDYLSLVISPQGMVYSLELEGEHLNIRWWVPTVEPKTNTFMISIPLETWPLLNKEVERIGGAQDRPSG